MEENKFEKQVQQKMDELKIHPSDSVWEKIGARIEKKKRPNRGLIFFMLLFCLLFTGGYFIWDINRHSNKKDNKEANNFIKNSNKDTSNSENSEKTTHEISAKEVKTEKPGANFVTPSISQKTGGEVDNTSEEKNINGNSLRHYKASTNRKVNSKINSGNQGTITSSSPKETTKDVSENIQSRQETVQTGNTPSPGEKIDETPKESTSKKDSVVLLPKSIVKEPFAKVKDTSDQKQKTASVSHPKKNTWKFGILFSAGISSIGNTFPGLNNSSAYLNDPAVGGTTGGVPGPLTPSRIKPGFGFMAGVVAEKKISAKIKLVTGINYGSFNTTNIVGERNDTTGYYNYNSQNTLNTSHVYKNHYNFIELPVAIKIQLGTGKNLPLFWEGGFVVSGLINTNALQFNQSLGYYYADNSIFNKTQIGVNTSLSIGLFSKQKNSVLIGPYFYYGASRLANEGLYNKKHFIFPGLRTEIIFGK